MLAITGEPRFADVMERTLYNSILSGVEVDGEGWSYTNPLRWHGAEHVLRSNDTHKRAYPGRRMICCPTNLMRLVASWHNYLYSVDNTGLWIHHYGANLFDGELDDGRKLKLTQQTDYPWDGRVRIRIDSVESGRAFCIRLRIPGWAEGAKLAVNGDAPQIDCKEASYVRLERHWATGDVIELDIPMPVRIVVADPLIEHTRNQVAVTRGPIVYCLESVDVPEGTRFEDICLPRRPRSKVQYEGDLLGGVTVLRTGALVVERGTRPDIGGYRQLSTVLGRSAGITMIPYYAWNNREEPKMTVWLPIRW